MDRGSNHVERIEMKASAKHFRVSEGDKVNLQKWSTTVKPTYKSKEQYEELLREHVTQLSSQSSFSMHLTAMPC